MLKVETRATAKLDVLRALLITERDSTSYRRGFLAGLFDAEGTHGDRHLRLVNKNEHLLLRARRYARALGLEFDLGYREAENIFYLSLAGGLRARLKFLTLCRPAIQRKYEALWHRALRPDDAKVLAREPAGLRDVVDIQTSTHTFIAAGLATHNCCYAKIPVNGVPVLVKALRCKFLAFDPAGESRCTIYADRHAQAPWCMNLEAGIAKAIFPDACPYVEGMPDYQGPAVLDEVQYRLVEDAIRKSLAGAPCPEWANPELWTDYVEGAIR